MVTCTILFDSQSVKLYCQLGAVKLHFQFHAYYSYSDVLCA